MQDSYYMLQHYLCEAFFEKLVESVCTNYLKWSSFPEFICAISQIGINIYRVSNSTLFPFALISSHTNFFPYGIVWNLAGTLARNEFIQILTTSKQNCEITQSFWNTSLVIGLWITKRSEFVILLIFQFNLKYLWCFTGNIWDGVLCDIS